MTTRPNPDPSPGQNPKPNKKWLETGSTGEELAAHDDED